MIADTISHGHGWGADLCFLLAAIIFVLDVILGGVVARRPVTTDDRPARGYVRIQLVSLGLAFVALGLLIL